MEVEQAERDLSFQTFIGVVGVGLGTASTAASALSPYVETITQYSLKNTEAGKEILLPNNAWLNFGIAFAISFAIGFAGSFITWLIISKRSPRSH